MRSAHTLRRDWRFHAGYGLLTGEADVLVEAFAELAVHMEEIAGTHDLVLMDAHRRAVLLGPGLGPDRAGDDPFAHPGLVAEGAGGGGGIVYECRFAVEVDLFEIFAKFLPPPTAETPNTGFRLFSFQVLTDSTQIPP